MIIITKQCGMIIVKKNQCGMIIVTKQCGMIIVTKQEDIQDIINMHYHIIMTSVKFVTSQKLQKYILNAHPPWFKIMYTNALRWSKYDQKHVAYTIKMQESYFV
jgi:hypothetical protein